MNEMMEVVCNLMRSSKSEEDWNSNCDTVKSTFDGKYPNWWYSTIILSGLFSEVSSTWELE